MRNRRVPEQSVNCAGRRALECASRVRIRANFRRQRTCEAVGAHSVALGALGSADPLGDIVPGQLGTEERAGSGQAQVQL